MTGQQLTFDATPEELTLFMSEAEEQLEILSQDILRLENEGDTNSELLQEIFRAAHTLKGSSGAIGHQRMARLTHAVETVLDQVRHHKLPVTTQLIDLLLKGLDALRALLDEVTTCIESDITIDDLCNDLVALANGQIPAVPGAGTPTASTPAPATASATPTQPAANQDVWRVVTAIDPDCVLPAARALQIMLAAGLIGTIVESQPSLAEIESTNVENGAQVSFALAPNDPATVATALRDALGRILEISIVSITSPNGEAVDTHAPAPAAATADRAWQVEADIDPKCVLPS
ncbi:MAG TPA: Hpt domain-containing protein, partial [Ktedonobacterales bacterium]|nr:Hpt domain-containing protein [Ktedonobacterales bacterium]